MEITVRCLALCSAVMLITVCSAEEPTRTFEVDYENDTFLMDGKPFRYFSGSVHYFRIPHQYWRDRLRKVKLLGLNAISTYVEWFTHEPREGEYNFAGDADLERFIRLAQEEGLYVIARVGPYICAEREFGGYPAWLLTENPNMRFRTSDPSHTFFVNKWFHELFKRLKPFLYGNGGPIIMVQVENEYGSYPRNDKRYLVWLRDVIQSHVGDKAVLFTTDGWGKDTVIKGNIPGVFATVDFGISTSPLMKLFGNLRSIQPHGPLVNSEFYVGWLSYWGEPMSTIQTDQIVNTMTELVKADNVSFNCYMIHGGTNFGFTSGSGSSDIQKLSLTSYDYDAPITEAGDITEKYMAIRKVLKDNGYSVGTDEEIERIRNSRKGEYGVVHLNPKISLLTSPIGMPTYRTTYPQTMEYFGQRYGLIAYSHVLKETARDPSVLQVNVRDRALVMLDDEIISVLAYTIINETPLPPNVKPGMKLTLLVENEGRRNYQRLSDVTKGIVGNATLDGTLLEDWATVGYELTTEDIWVIEELVSTQPKNPHPSEVKFPMFFCGELMLPPSVDDTDQPMPMSNEVIPNMVTSPPLTAEMPEVVTEVAVDEVEDEKRESTAVHTDDVTVTLTNETESSMVNETSAGAVEGETEGATELPKVTEIPAEIQRKKRGTPANVHPLDTFLDVTGWGKGIVWVNGHNLGRYWHVGSQRTLYVPGVWLKPYPEVNKITVLELHYTSPNRTMEFITKPIYEFPTPAVEKLQ